MSRGFARLGLAVAAVVFGVAPGLAQDGAGLQPGAPVPVATGRARVEATVSCPSCNDFDFCTDDSCDTTTGTCRHLPRSCDDGNSCTVDRCVRQTYELGAGYCEHQALPDHAACDDGEACTLREECAAGVCVPAVVLEENMPCDDGNPCTAGDVCDASKRCVGTTLGIGTACDDADACTSDDRCVAGPEVGTVCRGTGLDCADGDLCTEDRCDPLIGQCSHPPVSCDDGNACTTDLCEPATGLCRRDNVPGECSDGTGCTSGDACVAGNCVGESITCPNIGSCAVGRCDPYDGYCRYHDDQSLCPPPEQCSGSICTNGHCQYVGWSGTRCSLGDTSCTIGRCERGNCVPDVTFTCNDNNPCTEDVCGPNVTCNPIPRPDGTACGGDLCLTVGTCLAGTCSGGGTPTNCDDGDPCTTDSCDPATGCRHAPRDCGDGNECTRDFCSTTTGQCVNVPESNVACHGPGETPCNRTFCENGACTGSAAVSCEDANPCTQDRCDVYRGGCVHDVNTCDDGNNCTTDRCTASGGCEHLPYAAGVPCDDGNACTRSDICLVSPGVGMVCAGNGPTCDDGNPCTTDVGVVEGNLCVCDHLPVENACCVAGSPMSCDDGNACTSDFCDPATGCFHGGAGTPNPPPETCNGVDDDCDGQVDERELYPMCAVRPLVMRDSGTSKTFIVTCRWKPACPGAPVPAPIDEIRSVWLSAADLLLDSGDNTPLPNPLAHCDAAIVEDPVKRMTGDAAVTFVFDEDGDGVCGTTGGGRPGLMQHLDDVPDGKLARVCIRGQGAGAEHCGIVLVRHDGGTEPQPVSPGAEERRLLPAP